MNSTLLNLKPYDKLQGFFEINTVKINGVKISLFQNKSLPKTLLERAKGLPSYIIGYYDGDLKITNYEYDALQALKTYNFVKSLFI